MHFYDIPKLNKRVYFPALQEEMTGSQRIYFVDLILMHLNGDFDMDEVKRRLLCKFINLKVSVNYKKLLPEAIKLTINDNFNMLADQLDSLFEITEDEEGKKYKLSLENIKQFLPVIKVKGRKYYGPADALTDCTFYEYRTGCYWYKQFIETNEESDLDHLVAFLYRPRKSFFLIRKMFASFDGILRQKISAKTNPAFLEKRAKRMSKLSYAQKYTIFAYFAGCVQYLRSGSPVIDGNEISFNVLYEGATESDDGIGLSGLLFTLAETKVFGEIDLTDGQNLYTIMSRLYQVVKQQKKIEESYKKHNKS